MHQARRPRSLKKVNRTPDRVDRQRYRVVAHAVFGRPRISYLQILLSRLLSVTASASDLMVSTLHPSVLQLSFFTLASF